MTQCRHLLNARRTSSVVVITAALILFENVMEPLTAQTVLMNLNAVINLVNPHLRLLVLF